MMSETQSDMSTAVTPQEMLASMSGITARFQVMRRAESPRSTRARIEARSSRPMAGMPHSSSCTPMASRVLAMAIFSLALKTTPAVCSPSRKVVSPINTCFFDSSLMLSSHETYLSHAAVGALTHINAAFPGELSISCAT